MNNQTKAANIKIIINILILLKYQINFQNISIIFISFYHILIIKKKYFQFKEKKILKKYFSSNFKFEGIFIILLN